MMGSVRRFFKISCVCLGLLGVTFSPPARSFEPSATTVAIIGAAAAVGSEALKFLKEQVMSVVTSETKRAELIRWLRACRGTCRRVDREAEFIRTFFDTLPYVPANIAAKLEESIYDHVSKERAYKYMFSINVLRAMVPPTEQTPILRGPRSAEYIGFYPDFRRKIECGDFSTVGDGIWASTCDELVATVLRLRGYGIEKVEEYSAMIEEWMANGNVSRVMTLPYSNGNEKIPDCMRVYYIGAHVTHQGKLADYASAPLLVVHIPNTGAGAGDDFNTFLQTPEDDAERKDWLQMLKEKAPNLEEFYRVYEEHFLSSAVRKKYGFDVISGQSEAEHQDVPSRRARGMVGAMREAAGNAGSQLGSYGSLSSLRQAFGAGYDAARAAATPIPDTEDRYGEVVITEPPRPMRVASDEEARRRDATL